MAISPLLATRTLLNTGREHNDPVKRVAPLLLAAGVLLSAPPGAGAALPFKRCSDAGFGCARVTVPLDRSGRSPGNVSLLVERLRSAVRPSQGATFVLAGGPGESATGAFGPEALPTLRPAFNTRDLIVFDERGTGRSGLLRCRRLERANLLDAGRAAAECARGLGPRRAFYTTRDSVEDLEAVRSALGVQRIALFGTSYGTKLALAYARRHPERVERLVLDSVVEEDGPDPFYRDTIAAVPRTLRAVCGSRCRRFTRDPVDELERLVGRLANGPLRGRIVDRHGRRRPATVSGSELLSVLLAGDFDPSLRAAFPAAVHSALRGDPAALLRLKRRALAVGGQPPDPRGLSAAVYASTTCEELPFPWSRDAPPAERPRQARQAAEGLPGSVFLPFDRLTVLDSDLLKLCEEWPAAAASPAPGGGSLPDVPVLLLSGEDDLRTPLENAERVAAGFRQAQVLEARATGHSVLGSDLSGCAERAFESFFLGRQPPARCPRVRRDFPPDQPAPASLRQVRRAPGVRGVRGRAVGAVALALRDVLEDAFTELMLENAQAEARGGGLRSGRYRIDEDGVLTVRGIEYAPGVRITGRIRRFGDQAQRGRLRVRGRAAPNGLLAIHGNRVRGRLGGRRVRGLLRPTATPAGGPARASRLPGPAGR
jgi:pimeloyl-ACP methyl ester carboxylesterase